MKPIVTRINRPTTESVRKGPPSPPLDIVIGVDFGTSASKVVVRTPYRNDRWCMAMRLGTKSAKPSAPERYLLPSAVFQAPDGAFSLDQAQGFTRNDNLKYELLRDSALPRSWAVSAAYLALVLRRTLTLMRGETRFSNPGGVHRYSLNLGCPSAGYDDDPIRLNFLRLACAAWELSRGDRPIDERAASDAWTATNTAHESAATAATAPDGTRIVVIPEFAGEVATYAQSDERRDDLHFVLDVGASTLDFCSFVLRYLKDSDRYQVLTAGVEKLGVYELHRARLAAIPDIGAVQSHLRELSSSEIVPESASAYGDHRDAVDRQDSQFIKRCAEFILSEVKAVKLNRYPGSQAWQTRLPFFFCGGGMHHGIYRRLVDELRRRSENFLPPIDERLLPMSKGLKAQGISDECFARLAVAHGLSFNVDDIGEFRVKKMAPDLPRGGPPPNLQGPISKEDV